MINLVLGPLVSRARGDLGMLGCPESQLALQLGMWYLSTEMFAL